VTASRWYEAFPPRGMTLADVTAVTRVLAGRPRFGMLNLQPIVVFELWLHKDRVRWLVGMDERLAASLPEEFSAQPGTPGCCRRHHGGTAAATYETAAHRVGRASVGHRPQSVPH